ncbi:hypothetical protein FH972_023685 [Carpinus fangiana]|uniref:Uncharacterized protein n=1 Tax=Carpinus fangiana TaxID=176857 RepID=A0A5N6KW60_9ROSI|nr:hypothetical protein FH972_023685 [Carpinus fangiana]
MTNKPKISQERTEVAQYLRSVLTGPLASSDPLTSSIVGSAPLAQLRRNPGAVVRLAHTKLHSHYPFSEVPICWRRCFEEACLWEVLGLLEGGTLADALAASGSGDSNDDDIIRLCDDAIILAGAPGRRGLIDTVLKAVDDIHDVDLLGALFPNDFSNDDGEISDESHNESDDSQGLRDARVAQGEFDSRPTKRCRLEPWVSATPALPSWCRGMPSRFRTGSRISCDDAMAKHMPHVVPSVCAPSLSMFAQHLAVTSPSPIIIQNALDYWPAMSRWQDPRYWLFRTHGGRRRVPVEWGRSYVDQGWGQSIVPFGEFLHSELLNPAEDQDKDGVTSTPDLSSETTGGRRVRQGYLAQHDLLSQIPALRKDIAIPDYCYCSANAAEDDEDDEEGDAEVKEPLLNIWLGPAGTVSPAHTDPHHNLLAQVFGSKYVRLFSPEQAPYMYPMSHGNTHSCSDDGANGEEDTGENGYSMDNTSSVDVGLETAMLSHLPADSDRADEQIFAQAREEQRRDFPEFHTKAQYIECSLNAGDMLFVPRGWWHYVQSMEGGRQSPLCILDSPKHSESEPVTQQSVLSESTCSSIALSGRKSRLSQQRDLQELYTAATSAPIAQQSSCDLHSEGYVCSALKHLLTLYAELWVEGFAARHALTVQKRLVDHYIPEITQVEFDGEKVAPPEAVQWYPDQLAWFMTTPKNIIRKFAPFASFQRFLVSENSVGNITRQEIVSMIPPLFMDIQPGMTVLDMCAAPGSKSSQIIEMVHGGEEARLRRVLSKVRAEEGRPMSPGGLEVQAELDQADNEKDYSDDGRATGLLIANDSDYRRAQMLVHQCKRLNSPNLIVTNHDATLFPSIKMPSATGARYLKFDRILADVPCSGDGTARKNLNVWKDWGPANGLGLHTIQVRILVRALQMLKAGGRVVYSTCSMNPIENEAVVAAAVERCGGVEKVKLCDTSKGVPGLERRPGLSSWPVWDKTNHPWTSWAEVLEAREAGNEQAHKLTESMFPPLPETEIPLERCIRVYAHLQNTGGFFVAVLEKQSEFKAKQEIAKEKAPKPAKSSVLDIVHEIDARKTEDQHLNTLDDSVPSKPEDWDGEGENISSAARQNSYGEPGPSNGLKRSIDETDAAGEGGADSKRVKARDNGDEVDYLKSEALENRKEHWPPPPGAQLDLTEHHHDSEPTPAATNGAQPSAPVPAKKRAGQPMEEAFKYLSPTHPEIDSVYAFYSISPRFPRDRFMVRNASGEPVKAIYYTADLVKQILTENEGKGIKFVHSGVKMFVKQDVQGREDACKWRIQTEGLPILEQWVGEARVVRLTSPPLLRRLLREMFPRLADEAWRELGEVGAQARALGMGCCVLRVEPTPAADGGIAADGFQERLVMPLWRGISSVNLMLPKEERKAMLLRLFNDDSPLVDHSKEMHEARKAEQVAKAQAEAQSGAAEREVGAAGGREEVGAAADVAALAASEARARKNSSSPEADALGADQIDGGVDLKGEVLSMEAQAADDAAASRAANAADEDSREVAPGVPAAEEDASFNKTV